VGLGNVCQYMIPATMATAQGAAWNDTIFVAQPIQPPGSRLIQ